MSPLRLYSDVVTIFRSFYHQKYLKHSELQKHIQLVRKYSLDRIQLSLIPMSNSSSNCNWASSNPSHFLRHKCFHQLLNAPSTEQHKGKKKQQIYESWKFCNFRYNQDHKHFLFPAKFSFFFLEHEKNSKSNKKNIIFPAYFNSYMSLRRFFRNPPMHTHEAAAAKRNNIPTIAMEWLWRDMNVHARKKRENQASRQRKGKCYHCMNDFWL